MSFHKAVKRGVGRLTASAETTGPIKSIILTRLTEVSHKAPTRLLPLHKSSVRQAGAAICSLSNYGAGMLQGDSSALTIKVQDGATLGVTTQGSNRIYSPNGDQTCEVTMTATVDPDSFLVLAPDPCAMFAASSFTQRQSVELHPTSSLALIDWFSSGRYRNGERWDFAYLSSQTSLKFKDQAGQASTPFINDSVLMDSRKFLPDSFKDPFGVHTVNTFASLLLYGDKVEQVIEDCLNLQADFASQYTRTRRADVSPIGFDLSGRIFMGVSQVSTNHDDAYVVRFAAETNEDLYRVFNHCLKSLEPRFGIQFYRDRIRAAKSEIRKQKPDPKLDRLENLVSGTDEENKVTDGELEHTETPRQPRPQASWQAWMLADSGLPTGSFAHSAGIEAAAQLKLIQSEEDVGNYINVATRSFMQTTVPSVMEGHRLASSTESSDEALLDDWNALNAKVQAVLAGNQVACFASLDQGKSMARVSSQLLGQDWAANNVGQQAALIQAIQRQGGHLGPVFGAVGASLDMDEIELCRLLGFCAARDMVSASVRLSLIGPLVGVGMLSSMTDAVESGLATSITAMTEHDDPVFAASASAPIIETAHPCHEILRTRLFRS